VEIASGFNWLLWYCCFFGSFVSVMRWLPVFYEMIASEVVLRSRGKRGATVGGGD
jgi:energy-converting hydrogenase Eha subunit G